MKAATKKVRKVRKARRERRPRGTGFYVGCRELDNHMKNSPAGGIVTSPLIGTYDEAVAKATAQVEADGSTPRYIVQVVAKVQREAPPVKVTRIR